MHCSACEKLLQLEIGGIAGVKAVEANAVKGMVEVEGEGFDPSAVKKAINASGYKA